MPRMCTVGLAAFALVASVSAYAQNKAPQSTDPPSGDGAKVKDKVAFIAGGAL